MDFKYLEEEDPQVFKVIKDEILRQRRHLELIASENFAPLSVLITQASPLNNKYAEGYPGARWYGGCEYMDKIEDIAIQRVRKLFGSEYANVQPHSGTQANMAVMYAILEPGDTILAMDLACGGHLSHGHSLNFSGRFYKVVSYGVDRDTELIDFDQIESLTKRFNPRLIIAGASSYPRQINFEKFRKIADKVGAYLLVDMAHFAGLVAAGLYPNPCEYADFVTSTTHKTLRGPRGGFILCKKEFARRIDLALFPGIQGGPLMHVIAAKAVCFHKASSQEFRVYQEKVVENARYFCEEFIKRDLRVVSGGTDTHLLLLDLRKLNLSGKKASRLLEEINIVVNKNLIPYDPQPPTITSGIRIGTPALTSRGMGKEEIIEIGDIIYNRLVSPSEELTADFKSRVLELTERFPLYPEIKI